METFDKSFLDILWAELAAFQIFFHDLVIALGSALNHCFLILSNQICHISRNICCNLFSTAGRNHICLFIQEVDDTLEILCIAHRNDYRDKSLMELLLKVFHSC